MGQCGKAGQCPKTHRRSCSFSCVGLSPLRTDVWWVLHLSTEDSETEKAHNSPTTAHTAPTWQLRPLQGVLQLKLTRRHAAGTALDGVRAARRDTGTSKAQGNRGTAHAECSTTPKLNRLRRGRHQGKRPRLGRAATPPPVAVCWSTCALSQMPGCTQVLAPERRTRCCRGVLNGKSKGF